MSLNSGLFASLQTKDSIYTFLSFVCRTFIYGDNYFHSLALHNVLLPAYAQTPLSIVNQWFSLMSCTPPCPLVTLIIMIESAHPTSRRGGPQRWSVENGLARARRIVNVTKIDS